MDIASMPSVSHIMHRVLMKAKNDIFAKFFSKKCVLLFYARPVYKVKVVRPIINLSSAPAAGKVLTTVGLCVDGKEGIIA